MLHLKVLHLVHYQTIFNTDFIPMGQMSVVYPLPNLNASVRMEQITVVQQLISICSTVPV